MKKLTKTEKQNLKKKLLRTFNIIGLIVGGLSFIVVLYAIIAGGLAASNSEATTAEVSDDVPSMPSLEQRALTPPSSYDLELSPLLIGDDYSFHWATYQGSVEASFIKYDTPSVYYSNIFNYNGLTITTNVYSPTTTIYSRPNDMWAFTGDYIGSVASSPAFRRFGITLDNRNSAQAFLFYGDFSTSGYNVLSYTFLHNNNKQLISELNPTTFSYTTLSRPVYIPPYSIIVFYFSETTSAQYLDRIYIDDIGSTAYDIGYDDGVEYGDGTGYYAGFEDGYDTGYDAGVEDGYEDGYDIGYEEGYNTGWAGGIEIGLIGGYDGGYQDGYIDGDLHGYNTGYDVGYDVGVADSVAAKNAFGNAFDLIYAGAQSVDKILSISIIGNITLGMLLFTPLIVGISLAVIKVIKG